MTISHYPPKKPQRILGAADQPLVWIDCEMTGLDLRSDRLLEVAVIVTDGDLNTVDEGVSYVIRTQPEVLDRMNPWCVGQHEKSGLTAECKDPAKSLPLDDVRKAIYAYITSRVDTKGIAHLAGNSVHMDKCFLRNEIPELIDYLHYRIVDVSTIKELVKRWHGREWKQGKGLHRALDDIRGSIDELRWYRSNFFANASP
ncbi:ribonuclease H-like protein [Tilletiaria anomala UBC 951]|uniref:Ribonuclease H-like protein n=1 Tax=Tilletiaria anomala (strain ATCC 24038 / CBS 436.72 / UBC 951) TaxID=1037660 RepID=A0A066W368_TILAU|nr:ribonuclease H-like protein [Tilletiaria anomala UBC 951]KDN48176.1 ribonuclease H-like protein [Tilletiaria anomala UBC 951]